MFYKYKKQVNVYIADFAVFSNSSTIYTSLLPLGFGVASHLGVISNMCTIGVGKTLFHVDGIEKNSQHSEKVR